MMFLEAYSLHNPEWIQAIKSSSRFIFASMRDSSLPLKRVFSDLESPTLNIIAIDNNITRGGMAQNQPY